MRTAGTCLIHRHEPARLAHELDHICRYEPTSTLRTATHE
jgi:hypothetical protein